MLRRPLSWSRFSGGLFVRCQLLCGVQDELDSGASAVEKLGADRQQVAGVLLTVTGDVGIGPAAVALHGLTEALEKDGAAKLSHNLVVESLATVVGGRFGIVAPVALLGEARAEDVEGVCPGADVAA